MCLGWAADKVDNSNQAEHSYQQQVVAVVATGADELTAIKAWMQQVQIAKSETV